MDCIIAEQGEEEQGNKKPAKLLCGLSQGCRHHIMHALKESIKTGREGAEQEGRYDGQDGQDCPAVFVNYSADKFCPWKDDGNHQTAHTEDEDKGKLQEIVAALEIISGHPFG